MSVPCHSCNKRIEFFRKPDGSNVPVDPGVFKGVVHLKSGQSGPLLKGERIYQVMLTDGRGRYETLRPVREGETEGVLTGSICHRSTCKAQGVPRS